MGKARRPRWRNDEIGSDHLVAAYESCRTGDVARAEELYKRAVEVYRGGTDWGLGVGISAYAGFLLDQHREAEARRLLEEIVSPTTDQQTVWVCYQVTLLRLKDVEKLSWAIATEMTNKTGEYPRGTAAERMVEFARRAVKEADASVAQALASRALEHAEVAGDEGGRWAALGFLGVLREKAGSVDEALAIWTDAFSRGSTDSVTVERLVMNLVKRKDLRVARETIDAALERGFPANVEERLRKRRRRCEGRARGVKPPDVAAYSERAGKGAFVCRFQTRVRPAIEHMRLVGSTARCFCIWRSEGSMVDVDLVTGAEIRRVDGLPSLWDLHISPDGSGLVAMRTRPDEQGDALQFYMPHFTPARDVPLPRVATGIAFTSGTWAVGCSDGCPYAFDVDGRPQWRWTVPASGGCEEEDGYPPFPTWVSADSGLIVCSFRRRLFALSPDGVLLWDRMLPDDSGERPLSLRDDEEFALSIEVWMGYSETTICSLSTRGTMTVAGTVDGRVFVYDALGDVNESYGLSADCVGPAVLDAEGRLAAAWSDGRLFLFSRGTATASIEMEAEPRPSLVGDAVVAWCGKNLRVIDRHGASVWEAEFARHIAAVEVAGDELICAAGAVTAFKRAEFDNSAVS